MIVSLSFFANEENFNWFDFYVKLIRNLELVSIITERMNEAFCQVDSFQAWILVLKFPRKYSQPTAALW